MRRALDDPGHKVWVFLQHGVCRALVALKFLILARILGPDAIGVLAIAMIALAAVDALTETGLASALIQRESVLADSQSAAIWTLLMLRGLVISVVLVAFSEWIALLLGVADAAQLIVWIGLVPFLRNAASIGIPIAQRERQFRALGILQVVTVGLDLAFSVILVILTDNILYAAIGFLIAEGFRTVCSHIIFSTRPTPTLNIAPARQFVRYGKWVWGSTLISFSLNQLDKVLIAHVLGQTSLGLFQMLQKLAQLLTVDVAFAAAQYLFPVFSQRNRENSGQLRPFFVSVFGLLTTAFLLTALCLSLLAPWLVQTVLGPEWVSGVDVFRILCFGAAAAAVVITLTAYVRAIGVPQRVTHALLLQAVIYLPAAWFAVNYFGLNGIAVCWALALLVTSSYLLLALRYSPKLYLGTLKACALVVVLGAILMLATYWLIDNQLVRVVSIGLVYIALLYYAFSRVIKIGPLSRQKSES